MRNRGHLAEHLAAKALGVPVDAEPGMIRARFRTLVRAVHPDTSVMDAAVDLGRLTEAKTILLARAARRSAEAAPAEPPRKQTEWWEDTDIVRGSGATTNRMAARGTTNSVIDLRDFTPAAFPAAEKRPPTVFEMPAGAETG